MSKKITRMLVAALSIGALVVLGTGPSAAKGGGGGHGGGKAHFSAGHVRGAGHVHRSATRVGKSAHIRSSHVRSSIAHGNRAHALRSAGTLGGRTAWNHWGNPNWRGGWNGGWGGGWGGWFGPVFWPYFYGNLFGFVLWPYAYYDPFWAYGNYFVWDAIFWPGPYYAYGPRNYDVYGYARTRSVRNVAREPTEDLAQSCNGLAPGVTDLPIDRTEKSLRLTESQLKSLDTLRAASSEATDLLKTSCSNEVSLTPIGRLEAVQKRLDVMIQAWGRLRDPLDGFYNSLNEEQRQRFAELGPTPNTRANRDNLAALCSRRAESFTQLPVQRVEEAVKPTKEQQEVLEKLKAASTEAAYQVQTSCPTQMPQAALERFDAVGKRLAAMAEAVKTVRPALANFYLSLTDDQKARFNTLQPPQTTSPRQG